MAGRKRVLLFEPHQSFNLQPHPWGSAKDTYAELDVEQPDLARLPHAAAARGLEATLLPGDVLRLPPLSGNVSLASRLVGCNL